MHLENIGFYTLNDERAKNTSMTSPLQRCELILTDRCNFKCKYCRGLKKPAAGHLSIKECMSTLDYWISEGLKNVRFSGGEPTLHRDLPFLVEYCTVHNVQKIAISTNGSADFKLYQQLLWAGANDFSISLDGCCAEDHDRMAGKHGVSEKVIENIRKLSKLTYVTIGMVFTEDNVDRCLEAVEFAHSLGVADIRVIPSAQYNKALQRLSGLSDDILNVHPILKYRVNNIRKERSVRGINKKHKCWLMLDDMAVAGNYHYPCIIYLREQGEPIGKMGETIRKDRLAFIKKHNPWEDPICKKNCLDVCVDYNEKAEEFKKNYNFGELT